jgi:UDP-glucose 4-epimerase
MQVNKSILITGAAGFIGGYTSERFNRAGWRLVAVDRKPSGPSTHPANPHFDYYTRSDLTDESSIIALLNRHRPEACIHLAGPASVHASLEYPKEDFSAQTHPLLCLLEAIRRSETSPRLLLVSSAAVYGDPESLPISEQGQIRPISPYGFHKHHQERLLDEYHCLYGLQACKARVFSTYGPGLTQLAVWDITRRAIEGDYTVNGTGEETRDYLFVKDVASALFCIVEQAPFSGEAINVGAGEETPIIMLAEMIYSALGINDKPRLLNPHVPTGNPVRWRADVLRLNELGFQREFSLDAGIRSTIEWIKANG